MLNFKETLSLRFASLTRVLSSQVPLLQLTTLGTEPRFGLGLRHLLKFTTSERRNSAKLPQNTEVDNITAQP